jgi:PAS domain S-box-containing protein
MGEIIRSIDWSQTPLGPMETWSQSLQTALSIILHSKFPMFLFWGDDLTCFYNDAFRPSLGADGKHPWATGRPGREVWAEIWDTLTVMINQVLEGEAVWHEDLLVPFYRNGQIEDIYWTFSYSPVYDERGKPAGVFVTCSETTDKVLTVKRLTESERRFRSILEQAPDPMLILKGENMVLEVANEPLFKVWNVDRDAIGKPFLEILPEMKGQGFFEMLQEVYVNDKIVKGNEAPAVFIRPDGSHETKYFNFIYQPYREDDGRISGVLVLANDVTAQVQARQALRIARDELEGRKRLYEAITGSTPDLIYVFDLNYKFIYANKALLTMWGRTWEESIGQGLLALGYEPWHAEMHEREIDEVVATKKPIRGEVSFPHATLGKRIYDYIFAPVLNEKGEVEVIAGTTRDISELKLAEEALKQSEEQFRTLTEKLEQLVNERTKELKRSNEDLLQFAHVASHDLKEPVRKIKTFVSRLQSDAGTTLSKNGEHFLNKIKSATERMHSMIEGVLTYSTLGGQEQAFSAVNLDDVIQGIENDLEILIHQKHARITHGKLPTITGAPVLIYQLFYNLLNNSLKFGKDNVPSVIAIDSQPILVNGREFIQIDIRDNGIGFPQPYAEQIFNTFTRLNAKDQYEGTGLGLALCKKIVERHGGAITAIGNENKGAVFTITLPVNP